MDKNPRLQRLRDFTVQIRDPENRIPVGTGIAISKDRILTCAHVVEAALDLKKDEKKKVGVYFPRFGARAKVSRVAEVDCCFSDHDDDMVSLRLLDGMAPLGPEQFAKLGSAEKSEGNPFRSYGYSPTGKYPATRAEGTIMGSIEPPEQTKILIDPIQLKSTEIDSGMSGSAVLDAERNLVVGLVAERYFPTGWVKGDIAYAVDNVVLTFDPFKLDLKDEDLPKGPAPTPKVDIPAARAMVAPRQAALWNNAPSPLEEWTGRTGLLGSITSDWVNSKVKITGLIGFGGEGKSSLARRWVDSLLADETLPQPDGVFWWGFYERRNVDEFFEAALNYMSGVGIDPKKIPSSNMKAQIIAAMLGKGRYLFVLDGLEVLQHQDGDLYGTLQSSDLKAFLEFFADPEHDSFCLVTSRAPLMDLEEYTTYLHRDVNRLSPQDGRELLKRLGVQGKDEELDRVVADWDGHALTLSLLASYLREYHGGDLGKTRDIPSPTADEPRYERVHRVLRRYDEHLTTSEKAFLKLFSVFRRPIGEEAFDRVFRTKAEDGGEVDHLNVPIAALDDSQLKTLVERLVAYRIVRREADSCLYTVHPLIRAHYNELLTSEEAKEAHQLAKNYYLAEAQEMPDSPSLEELSPSIEAVHHACQHGSYDEAYKIHKEQIRQRKIFYVTRKLIAMETELEIMREFFPHGDTSGEPQVTSMHLKGWILNEIGFCLGYTGQGEQAEEFYQRSLKIPLSSQDWNNASRVYQNLSELYWLQGKLHKSVQAADDALELARRAQNTFYECTSLAYKAYSLHLLGEMAEADRAFREAEKLEQKKDPSKLYLYSNLGIRHADFLNREEKVDYARNVTEANLLICQEYRVLYDMSRCHRVLGDIYAYSGQYDKAAEHYRDALDIARGKSVKLLLMEALLARGQWEARRLCDPDAAFRDLNEALEYARVGGYRIYEVDIRVALAWANLAAANKKSAKEEAAYAHQMSNSMSYYWGKVDAYEVHETIRLLSLISPQ